MPLVTMPDGAEVEMPDNPSPEQLRRLRAMLTKQPQQPAQQPGQQPEQSLIDKIKLYGRAAGEGAVGVLDAISTLGGPRGPAGLPVEAETAIRQRMGQNIPVPLSMTPMERYNQSMEGMGMPSPTPDQAIPYAAMRGIGATLPTLGAGAASGPATAAGRFLTAAPGSQLMAGAASGAASEGVKQSGGGPGGQLAAGILASIFAPMTARGVTSAALGAGTRVKNAIQGNYATPEMQAAIEAGKRFDVPVLASDVSQNPTVQRLGTMAEKIPGVGLIGPRIAQHDAAKIAAEKVVGGLPGAKYGEGWAETVKSGQLKRLDQVKTSIGKIYDRAGALAGDTPIMANNTVAKIDELLAKESAQVKPNGSIINWLTSVKEGLAGQPASTFQRMKGALAPQAQARFGAFRNMQDDIQEQIRGYYNNSDKAVIAARDIIPMQQLKKAMDADLKSSLPKEAYTAWQNADNMYAKYLVPYKKGVAKISTAQDPVELFASIANSANKKPSILYATLNREGKDALMYGMAKNALEKAMHPEQGTFSPQRFNSAIDKQLAAISVHPDKMQSEQIQAFSKLMGSIPRAGQFRENPPTGNRSLFEAASVGGAGATIGMMTGGPAGIPAGAAAAAAGTGVMAYMTRMLFTTESGKRLLLAAKRIPDKSPAMEKLAAQALAIANAQYAQQAQPAQ